VPKCIITRAARPATLAVNWSGFTASGLALQPSPPLGGHAGGGHVASHVPSSHVDAMVSSVASARHGVVVHEAGQYYRENIFVLDQADFRSLLY
jgi:hypothetical protein